MNKHKRFVWEKQQSTGLMKQISIIIDTETGVNYMFVVDATQVALLLCLTRMASRLLLPLVKS
jgi:hypothetical protein